MNNILKKPLIPLMVEAGKRIEKRRFTEPPIYICGCARSGTTLLLSILSAHESVFCCPVELDLFHGAEVSDGQITLPTFYRLYRTFLVRRIKSTANRYCEKSPANIQHVEVMDAFHQGRFKLIHIVRDGRDVILSRHPKKTDGYWVDPARWVRDVGLGLAYQGHPCVLTIRYEDLITSFRRVIGEICDFLELSLSEEILQWHRHSTVRKNRALSGPIREISSDSIGKHTRPENSNRVNDLLKTEGALALLKRLNYL